MSTLPQYEGVSWRHGVLMLRAFDSGSIGLGLNPGGRHCVAFLDKTTYSPNASLHLGV